MSEKKSSIWWHIICVVLAVVLIGVLIWVTFFHNKTGTILNDDNTGRQEEMHKDKQTEDNTISNNSENSAEAAPSDKKSGTGKQSADRKDLVVSWDESWQYADYSKIHASDVTLYRTQAPEKNITVALNAGHGTKGGSSVKTFCHPDKSPKLVSGSTSAGETMASAISEGTSMLDGSSERDATLALALVMKEDLLNAGYDVLMIRENEDIQLDNIARTVIANQYANCHISLHYDSTENDKGLFYIDVPNVASYRNMEPVASHWQEHHALGEAVLSGMRLKNIKIYSSGSLAIDLTQTSYSTIPSIDLEVGDRASDLSQSMRAALSEGLVEGLNQFFSE